MKVKNGTLLKIGKLALLFAAMSATTASAWWSYQPKCPKSLQK